MRHVQHLIAEPVKYKLYFTADSNVETYALERDVRPSDISTTSTTKIATHGNVTLAVLLLKFA